MGERFEATVMRSTGSWYQVRSADGSLFKARVRGRLRLGGSRSTNPVVVGDRVECSSPEGGEVWIEEVLPRRNYIIRRSSNLSRESHIIAANIDRALVVATLFSPLTPTEFIDRFLVTCEAYGIPAAILLNKVDLAGNSSEAVHHFVSIYSRAGYRVMLASALTGEGIEELRDYLCGNGGEDGGEDGVDGTGGGKEGAASGSATLVSGNSGVGKSSLIGAVSPGLDIRTGEISRAHHKGMHTTTFSQMYRLGGDGAAGGENYIIDTPGIKGFGLIDISAGELCRYFPEMMRVAPQCGYYNCTHTHEPDCAVVRAVEAGEIAPERYISYLKMLEEDEKYRS